MENNENGSMVDYIIKKWFPVIGILFVVGGIAYLFYDGLWQNFDEAGRLMVGFISGTLFIAGGYSFDKKLKGFGDAVIGGGVLILYLSLIFGSRFESAAIALIPEIWALIIALAFSVAIGGYSYIRKSRYILGIGLLGGYLTPFFIGKAGEFNDYLVDGAVFDYNLSLPVFLIYFSVLGLSMFLVSNKMFLKGMGLLNSLGLFLGTLSLAGLMGSEFALHTGALVIFSLVVMLFHISAMAINAKKFEKQTDPFLIGGYVLPLIWFVVFVGSFISPELSDTTLSSMFAGVSVMYFSAWYYLRSITHSDKHFTLYIGGILSLAISITYIMPNLQEYGGLLFSLFSMVFVVLYAIKSLVHREIAMMIFAVSGVLYNINHLNEISFSGFGPISGSSIFIILTLIPFLFASPTFGFIKTGGSFNGLRKVSGYLAAFFSIMIIVEDTIGIEDIPLTFLFLTIPASIVLLGGLKEKMPESKNKFFKWSAAIVTIGFFGSLMTILGRFYPAPEWLTPLSTAESLVGVSTLVILYLTMKHFIIFKTETSTTKVPFLITFAFYLTLWSVGTHEILGVFNLLGLDFSNPNIEGVRAFTVTLWWAGLALFMLFSSEKSGHRDQKNIGFGLLAATILKLVFYDLSNVNTNLKVFLFIIIGVAIMAVAYYKNKSDAGDNDNDGTNLKEQEKTVINNNDDVGASTESISNF